MKRFGPVPDFLFRSRFSLRRITVRSGPLPCFAAGRGRRGAFKHTGLGVRRAGGRHSRHKRLFAVDGRLENSPRDYGRTRRKHRILRQPNFALSVPVVPTTVETREPRRLRRGNRRRDNGGRYVCGCSGIFPKTTTVLAFYRFSGFLAPPGRKPGGPRRFCDFPFQITNPLTAA